MDIQIQINVIIVVNKEGSMEIKKEEMKNIVGGAISYSLINAVSKLITTLYELGKSTGSAIRRITKNSYCPIN